MSMPEADWPAHFAPEEVGSAALAPFLLPLLIDPRSHAPYAQGLQERLLDLTVRMAKTHTSWYAEALPEWPVDTRTFATLPFTTRAQVFAQRDRFIASITTFAFATFTGGTTKQIPLMIERATEEQRYLERLIGYGSSPTANLGLAPLGLVAANGSHGEVFRIPGRGYGFSINFDQDAAFRKAAWLLQRQFSFPGFEPRISFIQGYFEFIHLLGLYLVENGIQIPPGQIRAVSCYGMAIPESRRACLSRIFSAPVSDNYSMSEINGNAPYNPADETYAYSPFVYSEVVDITTGRPVTEGSGELILTSLFPFTQRFPLIRYRTGDLVYTPARGPLGPLFRVRGRLNDAVELEGGEVLTVGDVETALEDVGFVPRREGFTDSIKAAASAAGPRFELTPAAPQAAGARVKVAPVLSGTSTGGVAAGMSERIRAAILDAVPDDVRAVLVRKPALLRVEIQSGSGGKAQCGRSYW